MGDILDSMQPLIKKMAILCKALDDIAYGEIQKTVGGKFCRYSQAGVKELREIAKKALDEVNKE